MFMFDITQIGDIAALFTACLVGGFTGPFLGGYLSQKASNLATKEDFQQILDQTKKTTLDVEQIRDSITSKSWISQQRWTMREKRYSDLLSELEILRQSLHERLKFYSEQGDLQDYSIPVQPEFAEQEEIGTAAFNAIRQMIGPAAIFLPKTVQKALEKLVSAEYDLTAGPIETFTYNDQLVNAVTETYNNVLAQAREDLAADEVIEAS